jgi:two-component system chemotaxis response regulator CheB
MIRVLIVDDQYAVREVLDNKLSQEKDIVIIGKAKNGMEAQSMIKSLHPDVITLDVNMPILDGLGLLRLISDSSQIPIIMLSSLTSEGAKSTLDALRLGAFDFVTKPDGTEQDFTRMLDEIKTKIRAAYHSTKREKWDHRKQKVLDSISESKEVLSKRKSPILAIAIGSSTGGTKALEVILKTLPPSTPGIVIVQHMPAYFTGLFAKRLNDETELTVKEAENGDLIQEGQVLIAPGDNHLSIENSATKGLHVRVSQGDRVSGHRPSVNVLFESVAKSGIAKNTIGIILTGMGSDGAIGMEKMKANGSYNIGQDEKSCVVFGMPREAWEIGAVDELLDINRIASRIQELTKIYF